MALTGLSLFSHATATGGSLFAPTHGPKDWVQQRDGASAQASLGEAWDPDSSQILTTASPSSDAGQSFATDAPKPIEPASEQLGTNVTKT
jgi:hypothetical protein